MRGLVLILIFTPILSAQVVTPGDVVSIPGGSATFFCSSSPTSSEVITSAQWLLNETLVENSDIDNVQTLAGTIQLRFSPVSFDHNVTKIRCRGTLSSGNIITSDEVTLLVQGRLSAVGSPNITASNSTLSLTWEPPFTLDITNVDPDITGYCVEVVNFTSSLTLLSQCGITETAFTYPIPPDVNCHKYEFTIRPLNIAGMGDTATATFVAVEASPYVLDVIRVPTINSAVFIYRLQMSAPVCRCEVTLLSNLDTGEMLSLSSTDTTVHDNSTVTITFNTSQVTDNHHYSLTVLAANSAGENSSRIVISTHDIIEVFIATNGTEVTSQTEYFEGSNAAGALYEFIFITDSGAVDFTLSALVALDRNTSSHYVLPFSLSAGLYKVSVYNIEQDEMLSSGLRYPAVRKEVDILVRGTKQVYQPEFLHLDMCIAESSHHLIKVRCTYPSGSRATGFQAIAALSEVHNDLVYINHTTNCEREVITLEVERSGVYLVNIIPILNEVGITNLNVEYTIIAVIATGTSDTSTAASLSTSITSSFPTVSSSVAREAILGIGIGMLALVNGIQFCIIVAQCYKIHFKRNQNSKNDSCVVANMVPVETRVDESQQLYAEIKDSNSHSELNIPSPDTSPRHPESESVENERAAQPLPDHTPVGNTSHDYDDVVLQDPKSDGDYQLTLCEAYGIH